MKFKKLYKTLVYQTHLNQIWPHLLMLLGCALVTLLLAISYTHATLNQQANEMAKVNKARTDRLDELLILVLDAETSIRGFLLTRNEIYLAPYHNSLERYPALISSMEYDFPEGSEDRPELVTLKNLIQKKMTHMTIALSKKELNDQVFKPSGGVGKKLMDEIRITISVLKARRSVANDLLEDKTAFRLKSIQNIIYMLAFGALFLILGLFYVQQRQATLRARIHNLLEYKNARLESIVELRTHELNDLASYLTNAREEERQHLARELHDELGALLTVAKMDASGLLRTLGNTAEPAVKDRFRRLIDGIGSAISLKRRIIDDLRPPLLQGLGLNEALRALSESFRFDIPMTTELLDKEPQLSDEQSLALFRIAQESLTNIRKYANAKNVLLKMRVIQNDIVLEIEDDGIGFDQGLLTNKGHGIAGMKHRTQMFNGQLIVRSSPGNGTRIIARIPMIPNANNSQSETDSTDE